MIFKNLIERLFSYIEKYHPFQFKYFKWIVTIAMIILLSMVLFLSWLSINKITDIVTEDFNQQQLMIARYAASQIENSLEILKRELTLLSLSPRIQYFEVPALIDRINISLSNIKHEGVIEVKFIEKTENFYLIKGSGEVLRKQASKKEFEYLEWAKEEKNKGNIFFSEVFVNFENDSIYLTMDMVSPVWQISIDESHPIPTNKFSGALVFTVDVSYLVGRVAKNIQSGKTGYAWVIDNRGIFLYHEEKSFIGRNAFEVRKGRQPAISFERINIIQKEKMLKGEEGMSWYISGWHRGIEGVIKKLIAYTPIKIKGNHNSLLWSIAVVAPISEVEGAIKTIHSQQMILQAIIVVFVLFGGLLINFILVTWSNVLEREVSNKTVELRKSEERYKSLIENAEDIIFTVNKEAQIISINKYGIQFLNKNEEKLLNQNIGDIFYPDGVILISNIRQVFDTKESRQVTHRIVLNGKDYWLNTNLRALIDEFGNPYAVLGISRDITDRKKMEEQSYWTEKLASLGTLAAGVAHEINNPLAVILGFTDLLLEKTPENSSEYDILKTIERQASNAKRVVENLLSFTRHREHREEFVNINNCVETVLSIMNNTISINNIRVEKSLQDNLPFVKVDAGEIQQVLFNIINNAIYVMQGGGTLTISTLSDEDWIEIRISDTGYGIKKEYRQRIFDPFFTTKEVGKGTGLGLWVSYNIVKKYNGIITFETRTKEESEETGTTFIIKLPIAKES